MQRLGVKESEEDEEEEVEGEEGEVSSSTSSEVRWRGCYHHVCLLELHNILLGNRDG